MVADSYYEHLFGVRGKVALVTGGTRGIGLMIAEGLVRGDVSFLDTRSQAEFDQGHLPGARCWDWFNAVPAGSWECSRDPEALRSELATLGVRPSEEVVVYCRSGMRAAHTYIVLRQAGFGRVRLYDGSWQEWSMRSAPLNIYSCVLIKN